MQILCIESIFCMWLQAGSYDISNSYAHIDMKRKYNCYVYVIALIVSIAYLLFLFILFDFDCVISL